MNGPTRSSSFERRAPPGGARPRGSSSEVFDELDQFVDSEPVGWPGSGRAPGDSARDGARGRSPRRASEAEVEAAFSRKPAPSRRDAFMKKLDEELAKPPERRAERAASPQEAKRRSERDAFARVAAEAVEVPPAPRASAGLADGGKAPRAETAPAKPPPVGSAGPPKSEPKAAATASAAPREGPADALDWELDNAIGAIVASSNRPKPGGVERGEPPPVAGPERETRAEAPSSRTERAPPPVRPASPERAAAPARPAGERPATTPKVAAASQPPVAPLGTRRATPIQTFRYQRPEDPNEGIPPAPPDVDDPLQSVFFPDAREAFDEVHGSGGRQEHDPYLSELAQDEEEFDPEEEWGRSWRAGEEEELPPSLSRAAAASRQGSRMKSVGIAAAVAGIAVLGLVAVVGFNVLAGGGGNAAGNGEPPIIRADARDVKERPEEPGPVTAEPDVIEQTELTGTEELVVPDPVRIGARPPAEVEAEETFPSRQVRTLVVRPDGTILPAGPGAEVEASRAADGVRTVRPSVEGEAVEPFDVAAAEAGRGGEVRSDALGFTPAPGAIRSLPVEEVLAQEGEDDPDLAGEPVEGGASAAPVPRPRPAEGAPAVAAGSSRGGGEPVRLGPERQVAAAGPVEAPGTAAGELPWGVQLASRRSQSAAEESFRELQRRYPSLLGALEPMIVRAEVGDRGTFYRVRIAAESRGEAAALCQRLKAAGADCFIGRN